MIYYDDALMKFQFLNRTDAIIVIWRNFYRVSRENITLHSFKFRITQIIFKEFHLHLYIGERTASSATTPKTIKNIL